MFCHKCGNELPEDAAFCPKCGSAQEPTAVPTSEKAEMHAAASLTTTEEKPWADRFQIIWAVAGAAVIYFVFGDAAWAAGWLFVGLVAWPGIAWLWRKAGHKEEATGRGKWLGYLGVTLAAVVAVVILGIETNSGGDGDSGGRLGPHVSDPIGAYSVGWGECTGYTLQDLANTAGVSATPAAVANYVRDEVESAGGNPDERKAAREGCLDALEGRTADFFRHS